MKYKILLILSICMLFLAIANADASNDEQEMGKVIFESVIIPFMNLSLAGEEYAFYVTEKDPEQLLMKHDGEIHIMSEKKLLETDDLTFEILWKKFNASKHSIKNKEGVPVFGTYHQDIGEIHSYYMRVYLKKPVLEITHKINEKFTNNRPENIFAFDPFQHINITTEIFNHGIYAVDARLIEMIHKDFEVVLPENSPAEVVPSGDETFDKQIIFETELDERAAISYQLYPTKEILYPFKTKVYYEHNDLSYTVIERNKTILDITSDITHSMGFQHNKEYALERRRTELGETLEYGITINNDRSEDLQQVEVMLTASERIALAQKKGQNEIKIQNNNFEETITIGAHNKSTFVFSVRGMKTGNHTLIPRIRYHLHEQQIKHEQQASLEIIKQPLQPRIVFNTSTENASAEVLLYLMNPNKNKTVLNLELEVETLFGNEWDSFSYNYQNTVVNESFLINKLTHYIYNTTGDYIIINGSFETMSREVIPFYLKKTPTTGYDTQFYKTSAAVSANNNLDLRYEEMMALYGRRRPITFSEKMSQFTTNIIQQSSEGGSKNNYLVPVLVFATILLVQVMQYMKRKQKTTDKKENKRL